MNNSNTLIIPGYLGSGESHWQTWMQDQLPGSHRVEQNWDRPVLREWAHNIVAATNELKSPAWLVAHSFGCLAAIIAAVENPQKIHGLMLVAPADPERFDVSGVKRWHGYGASESIRSSIPTHKLAVRSLLISSDNDPWMQASKADLWGNCWGSQMLTLKSAGHINADSGFGPWPDGLKLFGHFKSLQPHIINAPTPSIGQAKSSLIHFGDKQSTFSCFTT